MFLSRTLQSNRGTTVRVFLLSSLIYAAFASSICNACEKPHPASSLDIMGWCKACTSEVLDAESPPPQSPKPDPTAHWSKEQKKLKYLHERGRIITEGGFMAPYILFSETPEGKRVVIKPHTVGQSSLMKKETCPALRNALSKESRFILPELMGELTKEQLKLIRDVAAPDVPSLGHRFYTEQEDGGETIYDFVCNRKTQSEGIPCHLIAREFLGLIELLKYMAEQNIVHRDMSLNNILCGWSREEKKSSLWEIRGPKIIDWGSHEKLNKSKDEVDVYKFENGGTKREYMLPYIYNLLTQKRGPGPKFVEVSRNTMLASDMYCAIFMLFTLLTKHELVEYNGPLGYGSLMRRVDFFTSEGEHSKAISTEKKQILETVVRPLIEGIGKNDQEPVKIDGDGGVIEQLLEGKLGETLRSWSTDAKLKEKASHWMAGYRPVRGF